MMTRNVTTNVKTNSPIFSVSSAGKSLEANALRIMVENSLKDKNMHVYYHSSGYTWLNLSDVGKWEDKEHKVIPNSWSGTQSEQIVLSQTLSNPPIPNLVKSHSVLIIDCVADFLLARRNIYLFTEDRHDKKLEIDQ